MCNGKYIASHKIKLRNIALFKFLQNSVLGKFISSICVHIASLMFAGVDVMTYNVKKIHSQHCIAAKFISSICVYIVLLIVWSGLEPQVRTSASGVGKSPILQVTIVVLIIIVLIAGVFTLQAFTLCYLLFLIVTYCQNRRCAGAPVGRQPVLLGNHQLWSNSLAAKTSTKPTAFDLIKISKLDAKVTSIQISQHKRRPEVDQHKTSIVWFLPRVVSTSLTGSLTKSS